jgi:hypothetical protein
MLFGLLVAIAVSRNDDDEELTRAQRSWEITAWLDYSLNTLFAA